MKAAISEESEISTFSGEVSKIGDSEVVHTGKSGECTTGYNIGGAETVILNGGRV